MPLVLGVDSSTQSCKVELRDAETGALLGEGRAPHPADHAAAQRARSGRVVGRAAGRGAGRGRGATWTRCRSPASSTVSSCSTTRARSCGRPSSGTTPSPRPTREWLVKQLGGAEAWVAGVRLGAASPRSRSRSCRGCTAPSPRRGRAWLASACPHDWLTLRLSGEFVTDRGDASGTGYFDAARGAVPPRPPRRRRRRTRLGVRLAPRPRAGCARRRHPRVRQGSDRGRGHRRQHGRRARRRPRARATSSSRSGRRARCSR